MKLTTVMFDLDGTLLPMDQEQFAKAYFGLMAKKMAGHGYVPEELIKAIWDGTVAMVKNTGGRTNEDAFWESFVGRYGEQVRNDIPLFDAFYQEEFIGAKAACGFNPDAAKAVAEIKQMGLRIVLATNPIFPAAATENRIRWAGLSTDDFELYTTYENSSYCKPNPDYYREILAKLDLTPEECLMVGNDVTEDMVAQTLGMKVFLMPECIINKDGKDLNEYPHGDFTQLLEYIRGLL